MVDEIAPANKVRLKVGDKHFISDGSTFDITHWKRALAIDIPVTNGSEYSLFDDIVGADKLTVSATGSGGIDITAAAPHNFIQMTWRGELEYLSIRIVTKLIQGGTDRYRVQLRRQSDDSVVTSSVISINAPDNPDDIVSTMLSSYIGSATDAFVTDGFYIQFINNTGGVVNFNEYINIMIVRQYQRLL